MQFIGYLFCSSRSPLSGSTLLSKAISMLCHSGLLGLSYRFSSVPWPSPVDGIHRMAAFSSGRRLLTRSFPRMHEYAEWLLSLGELWYLCSCLAESLSRRAVCYLEKVECGDSKEPLLFSSGEPCHHPQERTLFIDGSCPQGSHAAAATAAIFLACLNSK